MGCNGCVGLGCGLGWVGSAIESINKTSLNLALLCVHQRQGSPSCWICVSTALTYLFTWRRTTWPSLDEMVDMDLTLEPNPSPIPNPTLTLSPSLYRVGNILECCCNEYVCTIERFVETRPRCIQCCTCPTEGLAPNI